jgi:hypothetical protein
MIEQLRVEGLDLQWGERLHLHVAEARTDPLRRDPIAVMRRRPEPALLTRQPLVEERIDLHRRLRHHRTLLDRLLRRGERHLGLTRRLEALAKHLATFARFGADAGVSLVYSKSRGCKTRAQSARDGI